MARWTLAWAHLWCQAHSYPRLQAAQVLSGSSDRLEWPSMHRGMLSTHRQQIRNWLFPQASSTSCIALACTGSCSLVQCTGYILSGKPSISRELCRMPNHYPITLLWNMQVHASEYGIHWNFFFTLAAVSLLAVIIHPSFTQAACLGPLILVGIV